MFIESTGMVCSVGLSADAACAAMRAGISNFQELPYVDNKGEPIIGALVDGIDRNLGRGGRLGELLKMAVADCLRDKAVEALGRIPLIVGLAEPQRPGGGAGMSAEIVGRMANNVGVEFHTQLSRCIALGHVAGFQGLNIARELFNSTDISACLICGVDSYINASSLKWLDGHERLKTVENSDGVIPGEGAAAVLVTKYAASAPEFQIQVTGLGFGLETAHILNDQPLLGRGLADAARQSMEDSSLQLQNIDFRIADLTGESYGFREQTLAMSRLLRHRKETFPLWHCADSMGDTGAVVKSRVLEASDLRPEEATGR